MSSNCGIMGVFQYEAKQDGLQVGDEGVEMITATNHGGDYGTIRTTIPKDIRNDAGIEEGDQLLIAATDDGRIEIEKMDL